jgi:hypothetical protein
MYCLNALHFALKRPEWHVCHCYGTTILDSKTVFKTCSHALKTHQPPYRHNLWPSVGSLKFSGNSHNHVAFASVTTVLTAAIAAPPIETAPLTTANPAPPAPALCSVANKLPAATLPIPLWTPAAIDP